VKWLQRWRESGSAAPKRRGGSVSPLEEHMARVLAVVAEQPDLTLVETVAELRKQRIRTSRSSLWRFLDRHGVTLKKSLQAADAQRYPASFNPASMRSLLTASPWLIQTHATSQKPPDSSGVIVAYVPFSHEGRRLDVASAGARLPSGGAAG
jgi:hypothetical protein